MGRSPCTIYFWNMSTVVVLLPPPTKMDGSYVFTPICLSFLEKAGTELVAHDPFL